LPAAIALNFANVNTIANIANGAVATPVDQQVLVQADHVLHMTHTADTMSELGMASVGAAIALGIAMGGALASSGLSANVGTELKVLANNNADIAAESMAGQQGAQFAPVNVLVTEETERQAERLLAAAGLPEVPEEIVRVLQVASAETADGSVGLAAALAANVDISVSIARTTAGLLILTMPPMVHATGTREITAHADASSVDAAAGLGVAVAINGDGQHVESSLGGNITAPSFNITTTSQDGGDRLVARATSGGGSHDIGVAGAFAINVSDPHRPAQHIARVADGAVLTISHDGVPANEFVIVVSTLETAHLAEATPQKQGGATVGIGPSVAINATSHDALAEIGDAEIRDAIDVRATAYGRHTPTTRAIAGTYNQASFPAAVALTGQANNTIARMLPAAVASHITGDLTVEADHGATATTRSDVLVLANELSLGLAVAAGGPLGGAHADAGPNMIVDGDVKIASYTTAHVNTAANSASAGPASRIRDVDAEIRQPLLRLAELTGVDAALFPAFDPHPPLMAVVDAARNVDPVSKTLRVSTSHGFVSGDAVVYHNNEDDTSIGGLVDPQTYFVRVDPTNSALLRLHNSRADALSGANPIALTAVADPEDQHTLIAERLFTPATAVDADANSVTLGNFAGLANGDAIRYFHQGGSNVGGLSDGQVYYVRVDDTDPNQVQIRFQSSRPEAIRGEGEIDLDLSGTQGTNHAIERVTDAYASQRLAVNPVTAVDSANDALRVNMPRGLETGDAVIYRSYGEGTIGSLVDGKVYYVGVTLPEKGSKDQPSIRFYSTPTDAEGNTDAIHLTPLLSSSQKHELIPAVAFNPGVAVDSVTDTIDLTGFSGLADGDTVLYRPGGTEIGGLVGGGVYFVVHEYPESGRAWLFESDDDGQAVIRAKQRNPETDDDAGEQKKIAKVVKATLETRADLDAANATGNRHILERVESVAKPKGVFIPNIQVRAAASVAVGSRRPRVPPRWVTVASSSLQGT
jgi:hypothetical protein